MKARIAIFQLSDRVYGHAGPGAPRRIVPLTLVHAAYPATAERIDAFLVIENLHVAVRMAFAIYVAPMDGERERVATSEEIAVPGDARAIEVVLRAGPVTLPRAGRYQFDLHANGKRVKAQAVMFVQGMG